MGLGALLHRWMDIVAQLWREGKRNGMIEPRFDETSLTTINTSFTRTLISFGLSLENPPAVIFGL